MKLINAVFCGGLIWLLTVPALHADNQSNPFQSITDRNVFALRPPPPPPSNEPPPGPPPQLAKVVLTGLTSLFGPNDKRAFLEIEETDGKGKNIQKPIMREGERNGSVEVLAIDLDKGVVKIRNKGFETNLVFAEQKATGAPPATPPAPGALQLPGRVTQPPMAASAMNPPPLPVPTAQPVVLPRRVPEPVPASANPAGMTSSGFTPATSSGAPTIRSYPATTRPIPPSAVPPLPR